MATATAMYHSGKNPLKRITRGSEEVVIPKGTRVRRLHKAFLRYHDAENWPLLREALRRMGRADLIGNGKHHLIPAYQPVGSRAAGSSAPGPRAPGPRAPGPRPPSPHAPGPRSGGPRVPSRPFRTQHTGLPKSGGGSPRLKTRAKP
jgi:hypothetical protein